MTEFERFFEAWLRKLDTIVIPPEQLSGGINDSVSWDRRAAYMMFVMLKKQGVQ